VGQGISEQKVLLDPGIGFGKTVEHNLQLLRRLGELTALGRPIVIGTSRKAFLGRIAGETRTANPQSRAADGPIGVLDRLPGTLASNVLAYERGARVFRVHDVAAVGQALAVAAATLGGKWTARSTATRPTS
jgi:dihydropteroate synthase